MPPPTTASETRDTEASTVQGESPENTAPAATAAGEASSAAGNTAFARAVENGGFFIDVGPGITISPEDMSARVNLEDKPQVLPGIHLRELRYSQRQGTATVRGDVVVPHLRSPRNGITVSVDRQGNTTLDTTLTSDLPVFKNKRLQVSLDEQHNLSATLTIEPTDLTPARRIPNLSATGGGTFRLANGKLSGNVEADLAYSTLGSGHFSFNFNGEGRASGSGSFDFEHDFLNGASAEMEIDEEANLRAEVGIPVSDLEVPIPGLSVTEGTIRFTMDNSTPGGALENLKLVYNGLGEASFQNVRIRNGMFTGNGSFAVTLAELTEVTGRLNFRSGNLTGSVTIQSRNFPRALSVRSGSITGTLRESGDIDFSGEATIGLGPAGTGQLRASKENGVVSIGATVMLENIPGLQSSEFTILFTSEGTVEGEAEIATDDTLIPGLDGRVLVSFRENLWSGETEINFTREDPTVSGSVTVGVRQTEEGTLVFHGSGELTAEVIPGVEGTAGVVIDEEGNVVLSFAFTQMEPYELFPENRREREFLNISRNIPLWAGIVVAVIRIRAGVRAGVGPGQIRNSRIEGTWEITSEEPPDLEVSSEFYMPAFVEGYVAFGAGLGVDVLLGSLTGGIEAMATAGLYGAVSVVPVLSYEEGDWTFDGTATLAAGARLKLSLNAWAEIEALWVTVWERTWELASHTMDIGPDLVLRANISMNLSNPTVPELTFEASDTDNEGLIDSAMPEDGPPSASTREALENRAEWSGRTREQGQDADSVPDELAGQASETEPAPAAPPRPPRRDGPPPGQQAEGAPGTENTAQQAADAARTPTGVEPSAAEADIPGTDQPRYPRPVTLDTLNEPPAPTPRTRSQKDEDLEAALRCVRLAAERAESTEDLAEYFMRIKTRFGLATIGFQRQGSRYVVAVAINPSDSLAVIEKLEGEVVNLATDIKPPRTRSIANTTVGIGMEANPLGPDHRRGSHTSGREQPGIMDKLVTATNNPGDQRYIRGHLLNADLGGQAVHNNLFPITHQANVDHKTQIETQVKNWVNDERYWVSYKVDIEDINHNLDDSSASEYKVDSKIVAVAGILDTSFNKINTRTVTIHSIYRNTNPVSHETTEELVDEHEAATPALAGSGPPALLASHSGPMILPENILRAISLVKARIPSGRLWTSIEERLTSSISGFGGSRFLVLKEAARRTRTPGVTDLSHVFTSTGDKASFTWLRNNADVIAFQMRYIR